MNALEGQEWINLHANVNNVDETSDNESNEITVTSSNLIAATWLSRSKLGQAIVACFKIYKLFLDKMGCVLPMIVVSILSHTDFRPHDHREYVTYFNLTMNNSN